MLLFIRMSMRTYVTHNVGFIGIHVLAAFIWPYYCTIDATKTKNTFYPCFLESLHIRKHTGCIPAALQQHTSRPEADSVHPSLVRPSPAVIVSSPLSSSDANMPRQSAPLTPSGQGPCVRAACVCTPQQAAAPAPRQAGANAAISR